MKALHSALLLGLSAGLIAPAALFAQRAGDRQPVAGAHPAYTITDVRPSTGTTATNGTPWPATGGALAFPIGGMDFMADGRLVVTSWRDPYEVFIVSKEVIGANPKSATLTKFATGLSEAIGVKVVNDSIYILEKDQLTLLLDHDNDGRADEYRAVSYDWTKSVNSKEYAMGLPFDGTWFYAAYGDPTISSGTAVEPVPAGRQNGVLRFKKDGTTEVFTAGLRVPGGMSFAFGQPWVTEIQGGYRPSSVVYNPKAGRFYGRPIMSPAKFQPAAVPGSKVDAYPYDSPALTRAAATPFVLNIPFKSSGTAGGGPAGLQRSPAQIVEVKTGPFAGQLLISESDNDASGSGEMARAFIEQTADGELQGALFHFTRNSVFGGPTAQSGFGRYACMSLIPGPDGNFYCGANGATSANWSRSTSVGLDRMSLSGTAAPFDILALRSMGPNAFEFEFTGPLAADLGGDVTAHLLMQRWWDRLSDEYGCCRVGVETATANSTKGTATMTGFTASVQSDRSKVTVTFPEGMLAVNWQYYFRWTDAIKNAAAATLYGTEAFYTLNAFGPGTVPTSVAPPASAQGNTPFTLVMAPDGAVRLNILAGNGTPYRVTALGLDGKTTSVRRGQGSGEVLFAPSELPRGIAILRVETAGRAYSRLISR